MYDFSSRTISAGLVDPSKGELGKPLVESPFHQPRPLIDRDPTSVNDFG